jgi:acyl carrier protein
MKEDIFNKIVELITANNPIPAESITMETSFQNLEMDSLDGLALITDLEEIYGISIPNAEAIRIKNVGQAVESLEKALNQ